MIGLPLGKALSGLTAGFIAKGLKFEQKPRSSFVGIPATFLSYVPEALFTYAYFIILLGFTAGETTFVVYILPKAMLELAIISVIMAALFGNAGFNNYVKAHFAAMENTKEQTPS